MTEQNVLLGEKIPTLDRFADLDSVFAECRSEAFLELHERQKFRHISALLLKCIEKEAMPCFLLAAVLEFIDRVNREKILEEEYTLTLFEFWLNHFSGLGTDEIQVIRGKIVGRYVPRDEYQAFFPVGMGKRFAGSHFVAAHLSPDVDTTVSSFWGWMDAFGCSVAKGTHQWSLPSGLTDGHIQLFFKRMFGERVFDQVSRAEPTMTLTALDLLRSKDFAIVDRLTPVENITTDRAIIVVDDEGMFCGEWSSQDAEAVQHIMSAFSHCLRWFEGQCQSRLIRVLANDQTTAQDVSESYNSVLDTIIEQCASAREIPDQTLVLMHEYLIKIIGVENGSEQTFRELLLQLDRKFGSGFSLFLAKCQHLCSEELFDQKGHLKADRVQATRILEQVVLAMEEALDVVRKNIERIDHLLAIKEKVLDWPSVFVTLKSDVDEMKSKLGHRDHLCVISPEKNGRWFPIGIVLADDLRETVLGTVSFRDFSNPEETKMASYIDIISIVDHHKMKLQTTTPPAMLVGDVQSSNTLLAESSLKMNMCYGMRPQIKFLEGLESSIAEQIQKAFVTEPLAPDHGYFVDTKREIVEYFFYLYGILDDTDLLTKISRRDVLVVKQLLDRMRSLLAQKPVETVSFADLPNDQHFVKRAAKKLLQNQDLHSIYARVYHFREEEMEKSLLAALKNEPSTVFSDTKEQNGCCRIGQTKLFKTNITTFDTHRQRFIKLWYEKIMQINTARPHIDFFLHMISTVPGEKEVFSGEEALWEHKDEFWIWIPNTGLAEQHLVSFLNAFQRSPSAQALDIDLIITGPDAEGREQLCKQNFPNAHSIRIEHDHKKEPTLLIMRFKAGAMNSRKSQVSPYLPKFVS